jgi:hypothetical protein
MKRVEERVCPIIEKGVESWDHPSQVEHVSLCLPRYGFLHGLIYDIDYPIQHDRRNEG